MQTQGIHETCKYTLNPTSHQERASAAFLLLRRHVYNPAVEERRRRGVSVTYYQQKAELPDSAEAMPEYAELHSQVLQDVAPRVDHGFQAYFRRVRAGERPVIRLSTDATAITASPTCNSAMEPLWTTTV
jgi:putative transposase